jgi:hypothetical protein
MRIVGAVGPILDISSKPVIYGVLMNVINGSREVTVRFNAETFGIVDPQSAFSIVLIVVSLGVCVE